MNSLCRHRYALSMLRRFVLLNLAIHSNTPNEAKSEKSTGILPTWIAVINEEDVERTRDENVYCCRHY